MGLFGDYNPGEKDDAMFGGQTRYQNQVNSEAQARELERARALSNQRLGQANERLNPWSDMEGQALGAYMGEMGLGPESGRGLAYMGSDNYQGMMDEAQEAIGQNAAYSGETVYGGRRLKRSGEAGARIQEQFQNNYMNMLSSTASPTTATNVSSLNLDQAATMGSQGGAAYTSMASNTANATQAAQGQANDTAGAAMSLIGMFL
jgi:hypothetical protein